MNCDNPDQTREIVESFRALLDEERARREIDEPVNAVLGNFKFDENAPFSTGFFHGVIAEFVREVWEQGVKFRRHLTADVALAEAIAILGAGYLGNGGTGYEAALVDAASVEPNGIRWVIEQMADLIKASQRAKCVRRILETCIMPSDWQTKRRVAAYIVEALASPSAPSYITRFSPGQLAPHWYEMAMLLLDSENMGKHSTLVTDLFAVR
ncbi:hypothetical protein FJY63_03065 [Candidatus Sumerlaeota bacterium]|nr:hypothetical protein [Candidatus Sumerlaeota bacterium]